MIIVRTDMLEVIDSVFKDPDVEDMLFDDSPRDVTYPLGDKFIYLAAYEDLESPCGLAMFIRKSMIELDCHVGFTSQCRGSKAVDAGCTMIDWIRKYTSFKKLTTCIPSVNKKCQRFAVSIGFEREGVNKQSFIKNGIVYDQVYYGLEV